MQKLLIITTALVFLLANSTLQAAETYHLQRGDVITHVNTLEIRRIKEFWKAVKHSEATLYLTVQSTDGSKKALHVELRNHKFGPIARFGADVSVHQRQGVKVTNVRRNSPATQCHLAN